MYRFSRRKKLFQGITICNLLHSILSEVCWGKAMVVYVKPQQWKKEESERLRREREIRSSLLISDLKDGKL